MPRNLYTCPAEPRHMSVAVDKFKYKLPYKNIFGGVTALTVDHFRRLNGYSNEFWGWGGEDDDMYNRVHDHGLDIARMKENGYYRMAKHKAEVPNPDRTKILSTGRQRYGVLHLMCVARSILHCMLINAASCQRFLFMPGLF